MQGLGPNRSNNLEAMIDAMKSFEIASTTQQLDPIVELLETYKDLNNPKVAELLEEPSALEFMRAVGLNKPFIVRGGCAGWKATRLWNLQYLKEVMNDQNINVAITPKG